MLIKLLKIWISEGHDFKGRHGKERMNYEPRSLEKVKLVAGKGIEGDRFFDHKPDFKGQVTFFSEEVARELEKELGLPTVDRAAFRRNALISGIDLNRLVGRRFSIGKVEFSGSEECAPCYWMDEAVGSGAHEWLKGRGGLRCRILNNGELSLGEKKLSIGDEL